MMRRSLSLCFSVTLIALVAATAARADNWSKTFSVSAKPHLALSADNARLDVSPGPAGSVSVRVTTTGFRIPSDVYVTQSQSGNDINVQVKQVHHWFTDMHGSVRVDVTVPAQADLNLNTGNGRINVGAVSGDLHLGTGNGEIDASGLHGNVVLHSGNGSIHASGLDGSLDAHSGNGSVHVSGRFDVLQVKSGRGSVYADALAGSKMASPWEVESGVGSVTLLLPSNFSADLQGSTGVGHMNVDFPMSVSGTLTGSSVRGHIGNGGPVLHVHTGVGSVHIEHSAN